MTPGGPFQPQPSCESMKDSKLWLCMEQCSCMCRSCLCKHMHPRGSCCREQVSPRACAALLQTPGCGVYALIGVMAVAAAVVFPLVY